MTLRISRRGTLKMIGAGFASTAPAPLTSAARRGPAIRKTIPSSGESLPADGMGTWQTFNVGGDRELRLDRTEVLRALLAAAWAWVGYRFLFVEYAPLNWAGGYFGWAFHLQALALAAIAWTGACSVHRAAGPAAPRGRAWPSRVSACSTRRSRR